MIDNKIAIIGTLLLIIALIGCKSDEDRRREAEAKKKEQFLKKVELLKKIDTATAHAIAPCDICKIVTSADPSKTSAQKLHERNKLKKELVLNKVQWNGIFMDVLEDHNNIYGAKYRAEVLVPDCYFLDESSGINPRTGNHFQNFFVIVYGDDELLEVNKNQRASFTGIIRKVDFYPEISPIKIDKGR